MGKRLCRIENLLEAGTIQEQEEHYSLDGVGSIIYQFDIEFTNYITSGIRSAIIAIYDEIIPSGTNFTKDHLKKLLCTNNQMIHIFDNTWLYTIFDNLYKDGDYNHFIKKLIDYTIGGAYTDSASYNTFFDQTADIIFMDLSVPGNAGVPLKVTTSIYNWIQLLDFFNRYKIPLNTDGIIDTIYELKMSVESNLSGKNTDILSCLDSCHQTNFRSDQFQTNNPHNKFECTSDEDCYNDINDEIADHSYRKNQLPDPRDMECRFFPEYYEADSNKGKGFCIKKDYKEKYQIVQM